jgi:hypothetical protein
MVVKLGVILRILSTAVPRDLVPPHKKKDIKYGMTFIADTTVECEVKWVMSHIM